MAAFAVSKTADERTKCIIFGYFRKQESLLKTSIPPIICYLCMGYYYNPEYFSRAKEDCFIISDDKLTVTNIKQVD